MSHYQGEMSNGSEEGKESQTIAHSSEGVVEFPMLQDLLDQLDTPQDQVEIFKADLEFRHSQLNMHARFELFRELKEVSEARGLTARDVSSRVQNTLGCDGVSCNNNEATKGAVAYIQGMDKAWFETFHYVNQTAQERAIPGTAIVRTSSKQVIKQVVEEISQVEHFAHALGERTTQKQGMSQAQLRMAKLILAAQMLMCIPVAEASVTTELLHELFSKGYVVATSWIVSFYFTFLTWITLFVNGLEAQFLLGRTNLISQVDQVLMKFYMERINITYNECVAESGSVLCTAIGWIQPQPNYNPYAVNTLTSKIVNEITSVRVYVILAIVTLFILSVFTVVLLLAILSKSYKYITFKAQVYRKAYQLKKALAGTSVTLMSPSNATKQKAANKEVFVGRIIPHLQPMQLEMAMDGSELFSPKHVSGILAFIIIEDVEKVKVRVVGLGFRHKDYLITAKHVYTRIESESSPVMLVKFVEDTQTRKSRMDRSTSIALSSLKLTNIVGEEASDFYDVVICQGLNKYYCKEAISSLSLGTALWGAPVRTVGITDDFNLQSAQGVIRRQELDLHAVQYSATTHPGWSGGPVLSGKKVVAMHKSARSDANEGLNSAMILMFIQKYEQVKPEQTADFKFERLEKVWRDDNGYAARMDEIRGYQGNSIFMNQKTGRVSWADMEDMVDARVDIDHDPRLTRNKYGELCYTAAYNDELNETKLIEDEIVTKTDHISKAAKPSILEFEPDSPLQLMEDRESRVTTAYFKGYNSLLQEKLDLPAASELGYDKDKYKFPDLKTVGEARVAVTLSLAKHLHVFEERRKYSEKPTDSQLDIAMQIVLNQCLPLRYKMKKDPLSRTNLEDIINSTRVDGSKSPGYPYITMGLTTNADVIAAGGLIEAIINQQKPWPVNTFAKLEPTKNAKLDNKMVRIISGVGLTDQIRTHAYFAPLNDAATMNYTKCPIQIGFSPLKVGDAAEFMRGLNPKKKKNVKFLEDDISTWDYNLFQWIVEEVVELALRLAVPEDGMEATDVDNWITEARKQALEQFTLTFRTPEGVCVERKKPCIMTSGSILTIIFNSFSMLLLDTLAKLRMGLTRNEIEQDFVIKVGGDDKIQSAPKTFNHQAYLNEFKIMGVKTHSEKSLETIEGIEFYSWIFTTESGEAKWVPTRFTKHVHSLLATKTADAGQALVSHMWNWAHDIPHFNWFRAQYIRLNEELPEEFPLRCIPDRRSIIQLLRGYEMGPKRDLIEQHLTVVSRLG